MSGLNDWLIKAEKMCKCGTEMKKMEGAGMKCPNCGMEKALPPVLAEHAKKVEDAQDPKKPGAEKPDLGAPGKDGGKEAEAKDDKDDGDDEGGDKKPPFMKKADGSDKPEEQKDVEADADSDAPDMDEEEGEGEEVEKGLDMWLAKAGLPSGVPKGMDERKGGGKAEVARAEDGGKLDGVGTTSGKSDAGKKGTQAVTQAGSPGKTDQFTPDDPNDTDKMKDELGMMTMPGAPAGAFGAMQAKGKVQKSLDSNTNVVPLEDAGVLEMQRERAQKLSALRKGEENIQGWGQGVAPAGVQEVTPQGTRPIQVMAKGGAIYSNASDEACMEVLEKGDFYHGTSPGFDNGNAFTKSQDCPGCGGTMMKALTVCPTCGTDRGAAIQKSVTFRDEGRLQDVRQTHSHGPGLRRAQGDPAIHAPDGLIIE